MFQSWQSDGLDDVELAKNHAYLLGSFWNPEAVKQMMDEQNVYKSTDEEFEQSLEMVRAANVGHKRHRRQLVGS